MRENFKIFSKFLRYVLKLICSISMVEIDYIFLFVFKICFFCLLWGILCVKRNFLCLFSFKID